MKAHKRSILDGNCGVVVGHPVSSCRVGMGKMPSEMCGTYFDWVAHSAPASKGRNPYNLPNAKAAHELLKHMI